MQINNITYQGLLKNTGSPPVFQSEFPEIDPPLTQFDINLRERTGGKELTPENIAYLQNTYDISNMSLRDCLALIADLESFEAISLHSYITLSMDVKKLFHAGKPRNPDETEDWTKLFAEGFDAFKSDFNLTMEHTQATDLQVLHDMQYAYQTYDLFSNILDMLAK